ELPASAADGDRRVRLLLRLGLADRPIDPIVASVDAHRAAVPERLDDGERFLHPRDTLRRRREIVAVAAMLLLIPAGPGTAPAPLGRLRDLGQQPGGGDLLRHFQAKANGLRHDQSRRGTGNFSKSYGRAQVRRRSRRKSAFGMTGTEK